MYTYICLCVHINKQLTNFSPSSLFSLALSPLSGDGSDIFVEMQMTKELEKGMQ